MPFILRCLIMLIAAAGTPVFAQCNLLDDMESGQGTQWAVSSTGFGSSDWSIVTSSNAKSPSNVWFAPDEGTISDKYLDLTLDVGAGDAFIKFFHTYQMEDGFDGGVIEWSTDGGATFRDMGVNDLGLILEGGYDANDIDTCCGNPLGGSFAWTGGSIGTMTRVIVDVSAYAGTSGNILRFRQASDNSVGTPGWQMDDISLCPAASSVTLTSVEPIRHDLGGGTPITVYGSDLTAGVALKLKNGKFELPLLTQVFVNGQMMAGVIPTTSPGTYDLVAYEVGGNDLFTLPGAVSIVQAMMPSPEDVYGVRLGDELRLSWSNLVRYDLIEIQRNGTMIDVLSGDATGYIDDVTGIPPGTPLTYTMIGNWGGEDSYPATVALPLEVNPCEYGARRVLGDDQAGVELALIQGLDSVEIQTSFELALPAPDGLIIRAYASRLDANGTLKARIRELAPPNTIVVDDIFIDDIIKSAAPRWTEGLVLSSIAAGEYIVGFYVDGGDVDTSHFALATSIDNDDRGAPYPCPPYPIATIDTVCGELPPQIMDIEVHPYNPRAVSIEDNQSTFFTATSGPLPIASTTVELVAVVTDPGGRPIVQYEWNFGDSTTGISSSPWIVHTFPEYGSYEVTLTVTNDLGLKSTTMRVIAVLPFPTPLPASSSPEIVKLRTTPDHFIPDVAGSVNVPVPARFEVFINAAVGDFIASVEGTILDTPSQPVTFSQPGPNPSFWVGTFPDMSILTRQDSVDIFILARDNLNRNDTRVFTVDLCPIPQVFGLSIPGVERQVEYDPSDHEYTVLTNYVPDPLVDFDVSIFGNTFSNFAKITATSKLFLRDMRWLAGELKGGFEVKLMSATVASQQWCLAPVQQTSPVECPEFSLQYLIENIKLIDKTWSKTILDNKQVAEVTFYGIVSIAAYASLSAYLNVKAYLDILLTLASLDPQLTLELCSTPTVTAGATASVQVAVKILSVFKLASLTAYLYPTAALELPSYLRIEAEPLDTDFTISHCVQFDLDYRLVGKIAWKTFDSGRKDIGALNNLELGPGCGFPFPCDGPFLDEDAPPVGAPPVPSANTPAIATSLSGTSLMVFSNDVDPDPVTQDLELYYTIDTGSGWSTAAPVFAADQFSDTEPELVFLDNGTAILVWVRNELDTPTIEALPETVPSLNTILGSREIYYTTWTSGSGWGTPLAFTSNSLAEGFPRIAAVPGANGAWVAWVGYDVADIVDVGTGIPNEHETSIYAQPLIPGVPTGPPIKLSNDDGGNPVADFSPTIDFAAGAVGYVAWVRETATDRYLMVAAHDGVSFASPIGSYGTPDYPGIDSPSIAISSLTEGIITFTSGASRDGAEMLAGNNTSVYAMSLDPGFLGVFNPPQLILGSRCYEAQLAEEPIAGQLPGSSTFVVAARSFASGEGSDTDGEMGVASIDLTRPSPKFSTWRQMTDDDEIDYDFAVDVAPGGPLFRKLRTVRTTTLAKPLGIAQDDFDTNPDLAVDRVRVSRSHPRPGSTVDLTVVVLNRGLATPPSEATTLRIGTVVDNVFLEFDSVPFTFDIAASERAEVEYQLVVPLDTTTIRVKIDAVGSESNPANNEADVVIGVLPPTQFTCTDTNTGGMQHLVSLSWQNADLYEAVLIYRNGRLRANLPAGSIGYFDATAGVGDHVYSVRGRVGDTLSDPVGAVCDFTVADCNDNGVVDFIDILTGASLDCNGNGRPDECDLGTPLPRNEHLTGGKNSLTLGRSCARTNDRNCNGIPDDCE